MHTYTYGTDLEGIETVTTAMMTTTKIMILIRNSKGVLSYPFMFAFDSLCHLNVWITVFANVGN